MNGRHITCPVHPDQLLRKLRYQKFDNEIKKPVWQLIDWYYCEACKLPVQVKHTIEVTTLKVAQENVGQSGTGVQ